VEEVYDRETVPLETFYMGQLVNSYRSVFMPKYLHTERWSLLLYFYSSFM
jgi:hypothetical protein